jgi:hypothetical protein
VSSWLTSKAIRAASSERAKQTSNRITAPEAPSQKAFRAMVEIPPDAVRIVKSKDKAVKARHRNGDFMERTPQQTQKTIRIHPPAEPWKVRRYGLTAAAGAAAAATAGSYRAPAAISLSSAARRSRSEHGHLAADVGAATGRTLSFVVMSGPDERLERIITITTMIFVDWHQLISLLY